MHKGFTLIELIVVISVTTLLLTLSLGTTRPILAQQQLKASANLIISQLRQTQARAQSENKSLAFDASKIKLANSIKLVKSKKLVFAPSGFMAFGGSGSLVLQTRFGHSKKIVVSSLGRIRLE